MAVTSPGGNSDQQINTSSGGNYVFTDLAHLNRIIDQWTSIQNATRRNAIMLEQAIYPVTAPAGDDPSRRQADRYVESLEMARRHSDAMSEYATAYVNRLTASRSQYATTEEDNANRLGGR
jgi:hypothetical protein